MGGTINTGISRVDKKLIKGLKGFPTSIISDSMNRMNVMKPDIKSVLPGVSIAGSAVTVQAMPGCNMMTHKAIYLAKKGDVIVVDGRGHTETAIWGGIQTLAAHLRGIAGLVVDGAVRDLKDTRRLRFPIFCRAVTCAGPHKGWGDNINVPISCGGVSVNPGDVIIADDDGICVVPKIDARSVLAESRARFAMEKDWIAKVKKGKTTVEILNLDKKMKEYGVRIR